VALPSPRSLRLCRGITWTCYPRDSTGHVVMLDCCRRSELRQCGATLPEERPAPLSTRAERRRILSGAMRLPTSCSAFPWPCSRSSNFWQRSCISWLGKYQAHVAWRMWRGGARVAGVAIDGTRSPTLADIGCVACKPNWHDFHERA
jgi:hypothetical protein